MIDKAVDSASAVVYATPDLEDQVKSICPDALYLPNPVPPPLPPSKRMSVIPNRIFFNARWDASKGGLELVEAARALVRSGLEVVGIDWGTFASEAKAAGVNLLPLTNPGRFAQLMSSAEIIVGQFGLPALGVADLMALQTGRPLMRGYANTDAPMTATTLAELPIRILDDLRTGIDPSHSESGLTWVENHHGPKHCLEKWENLYRTIY
ncbi:hypothetical protein BK816_03315 [Boudabousia tangfeifanii]|uniref:Glycosyl transferase family 1 domain-containing protein n=1 Tax=Boudabousia tangfeifanii TaxID=1912795 RepID=A0A1D9MJS3_9ACTO|nr:hypothetical protein BK816_03315 [Boudabousia tangfeifanii]